MAFATVRQQFLKVCAVQVLTTGSWPSSASAPCTLPAELETCTAAFEEFYKQKHSGRQLQWHPAMGTADLKATIRGKRVMLTVTTHQMVVLMLLNDQPNISFSHLLRVSHSCSLHMEIALVGAVHSHQYQRSCFSHPLGVVAVGNRSICGLTSTVVQLHRQ